MNTKKQEIIHIGFTSDLHYIKYLSVAMASILYNARANETIIFHIITDKEIPYDVQLRIQQLNYIKNFGINWLNPNIAVHHGIEAAPRKDIPAVTNYRLLLSSILNKIDKIIFLDADLIVKDSLYELWNIDISNYYIACCKSPKTQEIISYQGSLGIPAEYCYCNTGVMLVNLKKWREDFIEEKLLSSEKKYRGTYKFYDQCILNCSLFTKILYLEQKWNFRPAIWESGSVINDNTLHMLKYTPKIIHWASFHKPWNTIDVKYSDEFFYYGKKTPFSMTLLPMADFWHETLKKIYKYLPEELTIDTDISKEIISLYILETGRSTRYEISRHLDENYSISFQYKNTRIDSHEYQDLLSIYTRNLSATFQINRTQNGQISLSQKNISLTDLPNIFTKLFKSTRKFFNISYQYSSLSTKEPKSSTTPKQKSTQNKIISKEEFYNIHSKKFYHTTFQEKLDYISYQFFHRSGYYLNLHNPQSFNEKIQWLKLFYRDKLITICSDKYMARKYIADTVGEEFLVPLIQVYTEADKIDFNILPKQFVLKMNWGSGQNIICKDKSILKISDARKKLRLWSKPEKNHYYHSFEWGYKNILPRIICEEYLEPPSEPLVDFKFFCYNGNIKSMYCANMESDGLRVTYYDKKFNKLPFRRNYKNMDFDPPKPDNYDLLIELAEKLSKPFPFVRVDFYILCKKIYCGEFTFYPGNGTDPFYPIEWDYNFGSWLELPNIP